MHETRMSLRVIHPDGRTQDVAEYVSEVVLGAKIRIQSNEEELLRQFVKDYVQETVNEVIEDLKQNPSKVTNNTGTTDTGIKNGRDDGTKESPARHRYGWTTFTKIFKKDLSKSSPKRDVGDDRRGLFNFLRKRKSSADESAFTQDNSQEASSTKTTNRTSKDAKSRLMSADSGIAVEHDTDDASSARTGRLSRLRDSFRNALLCATLKSGEV